MPWPKEVGAAAKQLRMGEDLAARFYPGWGHPNHWDGHNKWNHPFPYWIPAVTAVDVGYARPILDRAWLAARHGRSAARVADRG